MSEEGWAVEARDGGLHLAARGLPRVELSGLRPELVYRWGGQNTCWRADVHGDAEHLESRGRRDGLRLRLRLERRGAALLLWLTVRNEGAAPVQLVRGTPIAAAGAGSCVIGSGADRWSVLRQGYQSWTGTRSFRASEVDRDPLTPLLRIGLVDVARPSPARQGHFRSDFFSAVKNLRSGETLLLGFLQGQEVFGDVEVSVDGGRCTRLAASVEWQPTILEPGGEVTAPPLWVSAGEDEHRLLNEYAAAAGACMRARVPDRNPVGWCSWYYYFTRITEEIIVENVRALAKLRPRFPCDYVQVDDGYQAAIGDWLQANEKFPRGMKWMAQQIRDAGFEAGIWTAPFIAHSRSRLLADHPEWFVKNDRGRPRFALWNPLWGVRGVCYALDTTHPEALDWLRQTFRTIAGEWGYDILKLDFLYAAALPGQRHDPHATRAAALRRGLEAVRDGAGERAFLLGCGCPLSPAVGVVDAMRIGPDVAPFWSNALSRRAQRDLHGLATKNAIRNVLTRAFLHRRWWLNDPDCLMIRDRNTRLTPAEVSSLATVIGATDGMVVLSDRVEKLSDERLAMLERTLELAGGEAEVIDLMSADVPEILLRRGSGGARLAVFNFADDAQQRQIDLTPYTAGARALQSVAEMWSGAALPVAGGIADLGAIPPHGCRVLLLP